MMDKILDTSLLMLEGSAVTLEIFCVTLALSLPLGLLVALGRLSGKRLLAGVIDFYIWIMRGTPLMLQLLFVYFALPLVGILLPDIAAALLAFVLNYAAYFAEIFRSGIQAVPRGQYEAARVLGMRYPRCAASSCRRCCASRCRLSATRRSISSRTRRSSTSSR